MDTSSSQAELRKLPAVNTILCSEGGQRLVDRYGHDLVAGALRRLLQEWRRRIIFLSAQSPDVDSIILEGEAYLQQFFSPRIKKVINATGIILHTNLGRAVLSAKAAEAIRLAALAYTNLEYDLNNGKRGSRQQLVEDLLTRLTGAESALVVNNNAAALLLVVNTLAADRKVIISRGELVEIGGSFRIPEVIRLGGAELVEVGTTNITRMADYQKAISENTALLIKVHTSNYRIVGFSQAVDRSALAELASKHKIPLVEDLGSGALIDLSELGLGDEEPVKKVINQGVDVVTFSGDKLLGGPQAGIIVGKENILKVLKENHLLRALRPDKYTLAALEATLREYLQPTEVLQAIPTYQLFTRSIEDLERTAQKIAASLKQFPDDVIVEIIETKAEMGAGSLPGYSFSSRGVAVRPLKISETQLEEALRKATVPIIGYCKEGRIIFDMRTLLEGDAEQIVDEITKILGR